MTAYKVLLRKDDLSDILCLEPLRHAIVIMIKIYFKNLTGLNVVVFLSFKFPSFNFFLKNDVEIKELLDSCF